MDPNGRGRKPRRGRGKKDKPEDLQFSVHELDPKELDVRRLRRGTYVALPSQVGRPWSEIYQERRAAQTGTSTEGMESEEGELLARQVLVRAGRAGMLFPERRARSLERVDNIRLAR